MIYKLYYLVGGPAFCRSLGDGHVVYGRDKRLALRSREMKGTIAEIYEFGI